MAVFDKTRTLSIYVSDQGADIMCRISTGYHTQAGLGWADWSGVPTSPRRLGLKPRVAICKGDVTGVKRRVTVATLAAYDAIVPMTTKFNVPDAVNTLEAATVQSLEGERHRGAALPG